MLYYIILHDIISYDLLRRLHEGRGNEPLRRDADLGRHYLSNATYLSNAASFVFCGMTCLIRLIEVATLFATVEENMR